MLDVLLVFPTDTFLLFMPTIYRKPKRQVKSYRRDERQVIYQDKRWKELRELKLQQSNYLCEDCLAKGIVTTALDVHHIKSFMSTSDQSEREQLAFDINNLVALCREHHLIRHGLKSNRDKENK